MIAPVVLLLAGLGLLLAGGRAGAELPAELEELTPTSTGIPNRPPRAAWANLQRLAEIIDTMRAQWGPVQILSAYRSPRVNAAVEGVPNSLHLDGRALDFRLAEPELTRSLFHRWLEKRDEMIGLIQEAILYDGPRARIHLGLVDRTAPGSRSPYFSIRTGTEEAAA